jgi:hypothetical protein
MYRNGEDVKFDAENYKNSHLPMVTKGDLQISELIKF